MRVQPFVLVFLGAIPFVNGQVCQENLVSDPQMVDDSKFTASSVYLNNKDPKHDYGPARGRINTTEVKDASGKTSMGAWSADQNDVNQYIQVELKDPTLIRGVVTQGRDGCCKQWVKKYRVLYSLDCKSNWKPVGGPNTTDAFFKGNDDENTPETNIFDCPVVARCVRINPLEWNNHISMRFDLLGCSLLTAAVNNLTTMASSTTGQQMTSGTTAGGSTVSAMGASTTGISQQGAISGSTTVGASIAMTTGTSAAGSSVSTMGATSTIAQNSAASVSTTVGTNVAMTTGTSASSAGTSLASTAASVSASPAVQANRKKCVQDCKGEVSKEYKHCKRCDMYIQCSWGILYEKPCPSGLEWNDNAHVCDYPTKANCKIP